MTQRNVKYIIRLGKRSITGITLDKHAKRQRTEEGEAKKGQTKKSVPVSGFTKRWRNRLIKVLNDLTKPPRFLVTLTFTENVSRDPVVWKRHLDNMRRQIKRRYPKSWWVWRIEPQEQTGRPHYHLVGSLDEDVAYDVLWQWIHPKWCKVIGVDPKKANYATRVAEITTDMEKLARYMSKPEQVSDYKGYLGSWAKVSNRWGVHGRNNAPLPEPEEYGVGEETLGEVKDLVLASIQTQIDAHRDKLSKADTLTPYGDIAKLKQSIRDKQELKNKITHFPDWFGILDADHIALIRQHLEDKKASGTL